MFEYRIQLTTILAEQELAAWALSLKNASFRHGEEPMLVYLTGVTHEVDTSGGLTFVEEEEGVWASDDIEAWPTSITIQAHGWSTFSIRGH